MLEVGRHFQENSYEREVLEDGVARLEVQCSVQGCSAGIRGCSAVIRGAVQGSGGAVQ